MQSTWGRRRVGQCPSRPPAHGRRSTNTWLRWAPGPTTSAWTFGKVRDLPQRSSRDSAAGPGDLP
eukprot:2102733-Alexandrium_andersonii.AAC.1